MDLENIMLSEISQAQKAQYSMFSLTVEAEKLISEKRGK
jgi:hypothetical protein